MVEPHLAGVWERVERRTVYVVPVTISEGYLTTQVIPQALGLPQLEAAGRPLRFVVGGREVHYCQAIGTHSSMTDLLLAPRAGGRAAISVGSLSGGGGHHAVDCRSRHRA
jgi:sirohydrochlorin ferrochelatase